jgi:UDP-N-acetylmuramate dehydrogenase
VSDLARAAAILREACGERVRADVPMAPLTTFRVGGPAGLYLEPESEDDLAAAGRAIVEAGIPVVVLGRGSNVLVADGGFPGLVLRLGRSYRWSARDGDHLTAGGAMPLPAMSGVALRHSLAGLEFGVAIPATLGGAVRMNAGAHGHEMAEVLDSMDVYRLREGSAVTIRPAEAGFSYRRSFLGQDAVVIGARLLLNPGDPAAIRARMDEARAWRRATQPLAEPNCGSVFKNPPGDHAARLIEAAGAKGRRAGGAAVSTKHANFIVTEPGARAADVVALIEEVRSLVEAHDGVRLESEVQLVGTFA